MVPATRFLMKMDSHTRGLGPRNLLQGLVAGTSPLVCADLKKFCSLDPAPTTLVVSYLEVLLPVITRMINCSLTCSHFPGVWKEAIVVPLLKKFGLLSDFTNLRPVSNLQFVSKLTERTVCDQTHAHLVKHELYPILQSAYRKGHSTETALLKVQNDILMSMDRQRVSLLILLDLSAAFDTVNHCVLLDRLRTSFGIRGLALQWFESIYQTEHSGFLLIRLYLMRLV